MEKLPQRRNSLRYSDGDYSFPGGNYFVTIRVKADIDLTSARISRIIIETLNSIEGFRHAEFPCFCIMPGHIHVIIHIITGIKSVSDIVWSLKRAVTRKTGYKGGVLWRRSFYDRIIRDYSEYVEIANYIADNPIILGLIKEGKRI